MFLPIQLKMLKNGLIQAVIPKIIHLASQLEKTRKVLGVFKDECGGKIISEFAALRAKCYSIKMDGGSEKNKNMQRCEKECEKKNHA